MSHKHEIHIPDGCQEVLLHACCAPCSAAIVEWMLQRGVRPVILFCNPNIHPRSEYLIRRDESERHARTLGIPWVETPYDHEDWLRHVAGLELSPERGSRCQACFNYRLSIAAAHARHLGIAHFATTLASSRWKRLDQVSAAGHLAASAHPGTQFWDQNWRVAGLQERRAQLLREWNFYNQQYCGCEFSMRPLQEKP